MIVWETWNRTGDLVSKCRRFRIIIYPNKCILIVEGKHYGIFNNLDGAKQQAELELSLM